MEKDYNNFSLKKDDVAKHNYKLENEIKSLKNEVYDKDKSYRDLKNNLDLEYSNLTNNLNTKQIDLKEMQDK